MSRDDAALLDILQAARLALAQRTVREGLSVRQVERLCSGSPGGGRPRRGPEFKSPQVKHLEGALQERLGARVEILGRGTAAERKVRDTDSNSQSDSSCSTVCIASNAPP